MTQGSKYDRNLSVKEIAALVRKEVNQWYKKKWYKISITSSHNYIDVDVISAPFELTRNSPAHIMYDDIKDIIEQYNYDDSNVMTDFFDMNFYYKINITYKN